MTDVIVLGGNGFIGSHLVDRLAHAGHRVAVFGRFRGRPPLYRAPDVEEIEGDFSNHAEVAAAVSGSSLAIHLISSTTPANSGGDPTIDVRTNLVDTISFLQSCVDGGVPRVMFASTGGAIYGLGEAEQYSEDSPTLPMSPYAIGKLAVEGYLRYFQRTTGLASTSLRISNPYGPRQHPHRRQGLIPIALRAILEGSPVVRLGDGSMIRDYIDVRDLAEMIVRMVESPPRDEIYNIGSGRGRSVNDVLESLRRVTGVDFAVREEPRPPTFVDRVVLDTGRFRAEYGEMDLTDFDDGVRATLDDLRRERG